MTDYINKLKETIKTKDREATLVVLAEMQEELKNNETLVMEITMPAVITELHMLLVSEMNIVQRLLQLRARVANRHRRAHLFLQTMMNGVRLSP